MQRVGVGIPLKRRCGMDAHADHPHDDPSSTDTVARGMTVHEILDVDERCRHAVEDGRASAERNRNARHHPQQCMDGCSHTKHAVPAWIVGNVAKGSMIR